MRKTAAQWLRQLDDPRDSLATRARLKLGGLEKSDAWMVPGLLEALDEARPRFWALVGLSRLAFKRALGRYASMVAERCAEIALSDRAFGVRQAALSVLAECPRQASAMVPVIARCAREDRSHFVRAEALRTLGKLGRHAAVAAHSLVEALEDRDAGVQRYAAIALKSVPVAAPAERRAIRRIAETHPSEEVRGQLRSAVARFDSRLSRRRATHGGR